MDERSDEQLFLQYRDGDGCALETLVRRYERLLYSYLVRYLGDAHRAEDVFQETFLRLARAANDFDASRQFRPWMYTIAANLARDILRKRRVRRTASLESSGERGELDVRKQDADPVAIPPSEAAERREEASALHEGIDQLRPDYRDVVRLHFFQGMKYREISDALTIPLGTVKSRVHAALKQLETFLTGRFADLGAEKSWKTTAESING